MAFAIGFSNFRQFKHFPEMPVGDITILVGANNAGKSTFVKALLLMGDAFDKGDYISSSHNGRLADDARNSKKELLLSAAQTPRFYFDRFYAAHVGTFKRALYNHADSNIITFRYVGKTTCIEFDIEGNPEEDSATSAPVTQVRIWDLRHNIKIICDYNLRKVFVCFHNTPLEGFEDSRLDAYFAAIPKNAIVKIPLTFSALNRGSNYFQNILSYLQSRIDATIDEGHDYMSPATRKKMTIRNISDEFLAFLKSQKGTYDFGNISRNFEFLPGAGGDPIEYIYAHVISQNVVYSIKDSGDYVSKTIHKFAEPQVQANETVRPFVQKWLRWFNIGYDYELISVGGESHIVNIKSEDGSSTNMADKGMGAIQLIILFFRLATIIAKKVTKEETSRVIIEEPEQNLHPSYQSKLADFFYEMNRDYNFRFIVETHSEYLVRKTQVLVNQEGLEKEGKKNPFMVYYFGGENTNGAPYYQMKYRKDGIFANEFGKGFFDEAANLAMTIL